MSKSYLIIFDCIDVFQLCLYIINCFFCILFWAHCICLGTIRILYFTTISTNIYLRLSNTWQFHCMWLFQHTHIVLWCIIQYTNIVNINKYEGIIFEPNIIIGRFIPNLQICRRRFESNFLSMNIYEVIFPHKSWRLKSI